MATSPTTKSALLSGAAKDDAVGLNNDYTFTIADLLGNDPGGAAKVDVTKQFLFGTTQDEWANQKGYLADHGITDNGDGTFTINAGATDFQYMVQIGNKGTWSTAHVDVTAPPPEAHAGELLFQENWDDYLSVVDHGGYWDEVNLSAPQNSLTHGWVTSDGWNTAIGEVVKSEGFIGAAPAATSGQGWLDTQNSPGNIDIVSWFHDDTGGAFKLSFDLGTYGYDNGVDIGQTAQDATFEIRIDGDKWVHEFKASDFTVGEKMQHFEFTINVGDGDVAGNHNIQLVDSTASQGNYAGFTIDTIQIHDWLI
jgi:hypothetical protein